MSEDDDAEELAFQEAFLGVRGQEGWAEIDQRHRTVVLAEAGAGKTHEMRARAQYISAQGRAAFFIRIEDIDSAFDQAFEVGSAESFDRWLGSQDEAWFFLDSVDEARLESPKAFEKALRRFSARIKPAQGRAHVCISSRPYAWRAESDRDLVKQHLPFERPQEEPSDDEVEPTATASATDDLEVRVLQPLNEDDIRFFASWRSTPNIDGFVEQLQRLNLSELASRPFDLGELLHKWSTDRTLGGRRELIKHSIKRRLKDIDPDRHAKQPFNTRKARDGARALAAAVVLTGKAGIRVPDSAPEHLGIDAEVVLADWPPEHVRWLLESAIFDGVTYGGVRFRHRDVREFLAAEWFRELLRKGHSRYAVESRFFREQYGVRFVSPRLRVILPWLILDDHVIRERALALDPEIAVDGGDPAQLPVDVRREILTDVVRRIDQGTDRRTLRDNAAIARIAQLDLASDTLALIGRYAHDDDAIDFLARVVWQGRMVDCVAPMFEVAIDPSRRDWARVAVVRVVMTCGDSAQRAALWDRLNGAHGLPRRILAEVVRRAAPDVTAVRNLLRSMEIVAPPAPASISGLTGALHGFVERLPMQMDAAQDQPLPALVAGLNTLLGQPPFLPNRNCEVSTKFRWLLVPALHAVERLVEGHDEAAMQEYSMAIMLRGPAVRHTHDHYHTVRLDELVPARPGLNDALFWKRIEEDRARQLGDPDFPPLRGDGDYWCFGPESFRRVLAWAAAGDLGDRKLAFLEALRIYNKAKRPQHWLESLQAVAHEDAALGEWMDKLLDPTPSKELLEMQRKTEEQAQEIERERQSREQARSERIARLRANPEIVQRSPGQERGSLNGNQQQLLGELLDHDPDSDGTSDAAWQQLTGEFGQDVVAAFRRAAMAHWREYRPGLRSEGVDTRRRSDSCQFGLTGLEVEASEIREFPAHLSENEVRLALRYIVWYWNGFPAWLEPMYRTFPDAVVATVGTELLWELENSGPAQPLYYVLQDLVFYAPWLHGGLVEPLMTWLSSNEPQNLSLLLHCFHVLKSGGVAPGTLAELACAKLAAQGIDGHRAYWFAIWVDTMPDTGIDAVRKWLLAMKPEDSSRAAQEFVVALTGTGHEAENGPTFRCYAKSAKQSKALYELMHEYISANDDVDHAGEGVYAPQVRDHAQRAREFLLDLLTTVSGREAYRAFVDLAAQHPDPSYRPHMANLARRRAEADGDIEPWTAEQVAEFATKLTSTPETMRQLFDLTVARVTDLKNWLETGDDSPYRTWRRAKDEVEMRNLIAGWLNPRWGNTITVAQEPELANGQRMDISLQHPNVSFPVPVELKLLRDGGWTGPKLCERLRNQLAGDYLREGTERCGLFLLIWAGTNDARKWQIGQKRHGIADLRDALKSHWEEISSTFANVAAIEVMVIGLTARERKSSL